MTDDRWRLLLESMSNDLVPAGQDAMKVVHSLMQETIKFRDKLLQETGVTLTVEDTRAALEILEARLKTSEPEGKYTSEQKMLAQIFVDRLTLFAQ